MYYIGLALLGLFLGHLAVICSYSWHREVSIFSPSIYDRKSSWLEVGFLGRKFQKEKIFSYDQIEPLEIPFMEVLTAFLFVAIGSAEIADVEKYLFLAWIFIVATHSDVKYREIPDELTLLSIAGMIFLVLSGTNTILDTLIGLVPSVFLVFAVIAISFIAGQVSIGGGDIKFLFSIGGLMGAMFCAYIFIGGSFVTSLIFFSLVIQDRHLSVPMMPGFSIAGFIYIFSTLFPIIK